MQITCHFATPLEEEKVKTVITEFSNIGVEVTEKSRKDSGVIFTAPSAEDKYQAAGELLKSWVPKRDPIVGYTMLYSG
ncbi:hypothetical protein GLAREA_04420 [Glarea lozoyensis ATCC 20868]|uniref:Uncharacterized protein n=1 Tax=Glarea lozoyensis (strain ATCC 20868 / MF5171) TaxID=1116229 RepID=S3CR97_GLAL2|nr:uncharacterized protein GLAREA_04420 [Glarea lozoyensis ATCC 20868]EPE27629.1 hypothetical protein GLAREA_04420 [Glarea lozoyensis ATCC 20868]